MLKYEWEVTGISFEEDLVELIATMCKEEWGIDTFQKATTEEDKKKGTDCKVLGTPIDVTLNINKKDRMWRSSSTMDLGLCRIAYGVRFGNKHKNFKTPTLVIGINTNVDLRNWMNAVMDELKGSLKAIFEDGFDIYTNKLYPEELL